MELRKGWVVLVMVAISVLAAACVVQPSRYFDDFEEEHELGRGAYGSVWKVG